MAARASISISISISSMVVSLELKYRQSTAPFTSRRVVMGTQNACKFRPRIDKKLCDDILVGGLREMKIYKIVASTASKRSYRYS